MVACQNTLGLRFEQSRRKTRQNRRNSSQQLLIDHGDLRKVRHFRRSAGIDERRQKIVLHHGPQKNIRVELLRSLFNALQQFFLRDPFFADRKLSAMTVDAAGSVISPPHDRARAILDFKKQRGRRSHFHLLVISRRLQRLAPRKQILIEFGGAIAARNKGFAKS